MRFLFLLSSICLLVLANVGTCIVDTGLDQNSNWPRQQSTTGYISMNSAYGQLYLLREDGSNVTKLVDFDTENTQEVIHDVVWSPDGSRVALEVDGKGCVCIYLMNADGSKLTKLTQGPNDQFPAWSPDGKKIAFSRRLEDHDDNFQIYVISADGEGETQLTTSPSSDEGPKWSPDGKHIVYMSYPLPQDFSVSQIYMIGDDGSNPRKLTNGDYGNNWPQWSPNGKQIAFESSRDGHWQIFVMNIDGTGQTNLSKSAFDDTTPKWSPDGKYIAFRRYQSSDEKDFKAVGAFILSLGRSSTTHIEKRDNDSNVTTYQPEGFAWSPDSKRIALGIQDVYGESLYIADVSCLSRTEGCSSVTIIDFIKKYNLYEKVSHVLGGSVSWFLRKD